MKKFRIFLVILLAAALLCADAAIWYYCKPARSFDKPFVDFAGEQIAPANTVRHVSVFGGAVQRDDLSRGVTEELGTFTEIPLVLGVPKDAECSLTLKKEGDVVLEGDTDDYFRYEYTANGDYSMEVRLHYPEADDYDSVDYTYRFNYSLEVSPVVLFSSDSAVQGDIVTVFADMRFEDEIPAIDIGDMGVAVFIPQENNSYISYVPVNYNLEPGDYTIKVRISDREYEHVLSVSEREYAEQHMTISTQTVANTTGPDANADYREKIRPTWESFDEHKYWTEAFMIPIDGRISTQFGLFRYTNGSRNATRHTGIDIASPEGTPVQASNAGKVIFAGNVIMTGNSVVIEHGGGLKTYYYHLSKIDVEAGEIVEKGQIIGEVGMTGYATGPHLHFEVRLGICALSPWELFDGTSMIYWQP